MSARDVPFEDVAAAFATLWDELGPAIEQAFRDGEPSLGPPVAAFEQAFADYVGVRHAIGVGRDTDALRFGIEALGIGRGDRVLVAANAPFETLAAIAITGAQPVLVDVDDESMLIDPDAAERGLAPRTRALVLVHLHGRTCEIDRLEDLAARHDLVLVEDAGEAHGACGPDGRRAGAFGAFAAFGFHAAGSLGAFGDAGAVTTDDDALAERLRVVRGGGRRVRYGAIALVPGSALDTLQAVVLAARLRRLDDEHAARAANATRYLEALGDLDELRLPDPGPGLHGWRRFVVRTPLRDALAAHLRDAGIRTGIPHPMLPHLRDVAAPVRHARGAFPVAEQVAAESLALPVSPDLTRDDVERVVAATRRFFA